MLCAHTTPLEPNGFHHQRVSMLRVDVRQCLITSTYSHEPRETNFCQASLWLNNPIVHAPPLRCSEPPMSWCPNMAQSPPESSTRAVCTWKHGLKGAVVLKRGSQACNSLNCSQLAVQYDTIRHESCSQICNHWKWSINQQGSAPLSSTGHCLCFGTPGAVPADVDSQCSWRHAGMLPEHGASEVQLWRELPQRGRLDTTPTVDAMTAIPQHTARLQLETAELLQRFRVQLSKAVVIQHVWRSPLNHPFQWDFPL